MCIEFKLEGFLTYKVDGVEGYIFGVVWGVLIFIDF